MQTTIALLGLAAVAYAVPQASLAPSAAAPAGCSPSYSGTFILNVVNTTTTKRDLTERQSTACPASGGGTLVTTLSNGKITDSQNRIGEVVANYQFQFDPQPQPGAVYTSGFSACSNGSLALGGSTVFYACNTGGFYNLYDRSIGQQCSPILLTISPCGSGSGSAPAPVSQKSDGQPTGTSVGVVSQKSDGQPTGTAVAPKPVSQISDGQIQATTVAPRPSAPVSQISDGQVQASTAIRLSQISDGQVQVPTAAPKPSAPVSQISDGQIQATTAAPKPSAPVSQISDGQIQATTAAPKPSNPVSQISDGQIQATTAAPKPSNPVSQISDGQIQATGTRPSNVTATGRPAQVTANSANTFTTFGSQLAAIVVGVAAVALL